MNNNSNGRKKDENGKGVFGNRPKFGDNGSSVCDWMSADTGTITKLIDTITSRGGAIRFGYTRDGGAYALGLYYGDEYTTEYCRPSEDLERFLVYWIEFYQNLPPVNQPARAK